MSKRLTKTNNFSKLYTSFSKISDYKAKLDFWDQNGLDFKSISIYSSESPDNLIEQPLQHSEGEIDTEYSQTVKQFISIKPENVDQVILYNEWVITHWKEYYTIDQRKSTYDKFILPLRQFSKLKSDLITKQSKLQPYDKNALLTQLSEGILSEITGTPYKDLLLNVFNHFVVDDEDGIYRLIYPTDISALREFRIIGRYWDKMKFMAFIETEKKKLKIKGDLYFKLIPLSENQMKHLFIEMEAKAFIQAGTCQKAFFDMLKQEPAKSKIQWIDKPLRNKKTVNKGSLIHFIDKLGADRFQDNALLYDFIRAYFEVEPGINIDKNLKSSNTVRNDTKHEKHPRYIILEKIIANMKSMN